MELAAESDDLETREKHRTIAKWIKMFMGDLVEEIKAIDDQARHPETKVDTSPEYMEFDSGDSSDVGSVQ